MLLVVCCASHHPLTPRPTHASLCISRPPSNVYWPPAHACVYCAGYLGEDRTAWAQYDSTELLKAYSGPILPMLVDQVGRYMPWPQGKGDFPCMSCAGLPKSLSSKGCCCC